MRQHSSVCKTLRLCTGRGPQGHMQRTLKEYLGVDHQVHRGRPQVDDYLQHLGNVLNSQDKGLHKLSFGVTDKA